jgi:hypothetical protein
MSKAATWGQFHQNLAKSHQQIAALQVTHIFFFINFSKFRTKMFSAFSVICTKKAARK